MPRPLAGLLMSFGHEAHHTFDLELNACDDATVFRAAAGFAAVIITKDSDFLAPRTSPGDPQIIWWRRGNESTRQVLDRCAAILPDLLERLSAGQGVIEVF